MPSSGHATMRHVRHAVILAGGSGTRLWPASRRARPKQFLALAPGGDTLLAAALERARGVAGENVVVVTADEYVAATRELAPNTVVIGEPVARNTAPAIGLAAATIAARDPDAVLAILPADQHVADQAGLIQHLAHGLAEVERDDVIGTIGIAPTRPETGFGYLEVAAVELGRVVPVQRFVEKPDRATAERYLASGHYLWNGGMFFARAQRILHELDTHVPAIGSGVRAIVAGAPAAEVYAALPAISIDHAVMERALRVVTIPAAVGWDDVGSWAAVAELLPARATTLSLDGSGNFVLADDDTLVATLGVSDLVIVKAGNAILVVPRHAAQRVREIVDALAAAKLVNYL